MLIPFLLSSHTQSQVPFNTKLLTGFSFSFLLPNTENIQSWSVVFLFFLDLSALTRTETSHKTLCSKSIKFHGYAS